MSASLHHVHGVHVLLLPPEGPLLTSERDAAHWVGEALSAGVGMIAIPRIRLSPEFLRLSSGLAGAVLQKFTNYRLRVAILGDVQPEMDASAPLRDFVTESNRGAQVWFLADLAALKERLHAAG